MATIPFDGPIPDLPFPPRPDFPPVPFPGRPELDRFRRPFEYERPVLLNIRYGPAKVRVLVMSDGSSYDVNSGFSLGLALQDAFDSAHPEHPAYARFEFTKAHRSNTAGVTPGYEDFRFTPGSLDDFDELWLFGFTPGNPYLDANEVAEIHGFMDAGGGVLAMGDHEDLGLGLCGNIKRVRSMRKWWFNAPPPPAGMIQAPDNANLTRNDTQQPAFPGGPVNGGSESDAAPQPIYPRYRYGHRLWRPWARYKYPHPVLCGPRGAIRVLPDHPHEGDCIVPAAAFAGEYPGGVAVEVIATGRNVIGRTKSGFTITDDRPFGLIGVWDGHDPAADRGRVLVDATWHHWFNINVGGLRAENGDEYKDILAYFRNVAVWLAPKERQARMKKAGQLIILTIPSFVERAATLRTIRPELVYVIGIEARDALGRIAPQCQSSAWFVDIVSAHLPRRVLELIERPEQDDRIDPFEAAAIDIYATSVFGGIVNAIAVRANAVGLEALAKLQDDLDDIAAEGAKIGLAQAERSLAASRRRLEPFLAGEKAEPVCEREKETAA